MFKIPEGKNQLTFLSKVSALCVGAFLFWAMLMEKFKPFIYNFEESRKRLVVWT